MKLDLKRVSRLALVATMLGVVLLLNLGGPGLAAAGAIWTTDSSCTVVNKNHYDYKDEVHLNGGGGGTGSALPDGLYYVRVTNSSGNVLLGETPSEDYRIEVSDGYMGGAPDACYKVWWWVKDKYGNWGYESSKNGVYKIAVSTDPTFSSGTYKSDNFHVLYGEPPTITCPEDVDLGCNPADTNPATTGEPTVTGSSVTVTYSDETSTVGCVTMIVRTWTATDEFGNTVTCEQTITYTTDETAPTFDNCPADEDLGCNPTSVPSPPEVTASDNCDTDVEVTYSESQSTQECVTTIVRTWTATDNCENTATCEQVVTYTTDETPPEITCPADVTVCAGESVDLGQATATDNCDPDPSITNDAPASFPLGSTTVTWTAEDACGNTSACQQTVTVEECDIVLTKGPDQTVCPESNVSFTIEVKNTSGVELTNVEVTDSQCPDCDMSIGALAVGGSYSYECMCSSGATDFSNTASVTALTPNQTQVGDSDSATVTVLDCLEDGWHDTGQTRWVKVDECTEKEQKEQEYRDYYCDPGPPAQCMYSVTDTQWVDTGNTRPSQDCDAQDGWYDTTDTRWVSTDDPCVEKEQRKQVYRDYYCDPQSGCEYEVTNTRWVDTGNTRWICTETPTATPETPTPTPETPTATPETPTPTSTPYGEPEETPTPTSEPGWEEQALQFGAFCDDGDGIMTWKDYYEWPLGAVELEISYRTPGGAKRTLNYYTAGDGLTQWIKFEHHEVAIVESIKVLDSDSKATIALYELPYCYFSVGCSKAPIWWGGQAEVGFPDRKIIVVLLDCQEVVPTLTPPATVTTGLYREASSGGNGFASIVSAVRKFLEWLF
ncbi:MAG: HYR domain-containing protein [Chloroflexota bacterium]|nr:HYR domain-containing protein [Chloroflexota bacterium]